MSTVPRSKLDAQGWRCAYHHSRPADAVICPGDPLALAYDGHGIVHLTCAQIGVAPSIRRADDCGAVHLPWNGSACKRVAICTLPRHHPGEDHRDVLQGVSWPPRRPR